MHDMIKSLFLVCVCGVFLSSCSKSSNPVTTINATDSTVILSHSLFEQNGQQSLNGWTFNPAGTDDTLDFEQDAPPGDGTWSYKLHTSDFPPVTNTLTRNYTGLTTGVYSLTAWIHLKYDLAEGTFPEGWISIVKISGGDSTIKSQLTTDSTVWHPISLLDTLSLKSTDTVLLLLSAGARITNQHGNPVWYDDITFKRIQ